MTNRTMANWGAAGFIGTVLILAAGSPADSRPPVEVIAHKGLVQIVHYGDLALTSKKDRNTLYHRVGYAVNQVCPEYAEDGGAYDNFACRNTAWEGARPQIRRFPDRH